MNGVSTPGVPDLEAGAVEKMLREDCPCGLANAYEDWFAPNVPQEIEPLPPGRYIDGDAFPALAKDCDDVMRWRLWRSLLRPFNFGNSSLVGIEEGVTAGKPGPTTDSVGV